MSLFPTIKSFTGEYRFLSNFHYSPVIMKDTNITVPTVEHAYQASKTFDPKEKAMIYLCETPGQAKRAGQKITLRDDWDHIKLNVMYHYLEKKFQHVNLAVKLLDTGDAYLEEGNGWGDTFWGVCDGNGFNHLGLQLMDIRSQLTRKNLFSH